MSARLTLDDAAVRAKLQAIGARLPELLADALRVEAEIEMTEAKRRTPVDTGALRSSGTVHEPVHSGRNVEVTLSFGGPGTDYAVPVHENLDAFHQVGQAKFLESVILESKAFMPQRIGTRLKADLDGLG